MPEVEKFRIVTRKKRGRHGNRGIASRKKPNDVVGPIIETPNIDSEVVLGKISEAEAELRNCSFMENLFYRLNESLTALNLDGIAEIICYGLGRFSQHRSSKYQLALLLSVKRRYASRAYIYDPAFLPEEVELLRTLGFEPIERNEEGKRAVAEVSTLVYMPHCSTHLTNNFLYANWTRNISNCLLLTNSFTTLTEYSVTAVHPSVDYVSRILPYLTEFSLRNDFHYEEAFNDFSIHAFLKRDIDSAPSQFWSSRKEPNYGNLRVEYITAEESAAPEQHEREEAAEKEEEEEEEEEEEAAR